MVEAKRGLEHPLLSVLQNLLTVPTSGEAGYALISLSKLLPLSTLAMFVNAIKSCELL